LRNRAIPGMSFRFDVPEGGISKTREGGNMLHSVREVRLYELGPVVFPAYSDTSVVLRSLQNVLPEPIHIVGLSRDADDLDDAGDPAEGYSPDGNGVQGLVEDAVEALWGLGGNGLSDLHVIETYDDHVVFTVIEGAQPKYPGLWSVNFTCNNGVVNIDTPESVAAVVPRSGEPVATETRQSGTSEEPARTRTSAEPAIEDIVIPCSFDERRAYLRRIELQRLRIKG